LRMRRGKMMLLLMLVWRNYSPLNDVIWFPQHYRYSFNPFFWILWLIVPIPVTDVFICVYIRLSCTLFLQIEMLISAFHGSKYLNRSLPFLLQLVMVIPATKVSREIFSISILVVSSSCVVVNLDQLCI